MGVDLVVHGLLAPADAPAAIRELRLPAAEKWLARARIDALPFAGQHAWLAREFSIPEPVPVAAIALSSEARAPEGNWLCADPVHVRLGHNAATLHAPETLGIGRDEAEALVEALNGHFRDDGLQFRTASPHRWYVRAPGDDVPDTVPIDEAFGRNVLGLLPAATVGFDWRRALTEAQMVLAADPVNAGRESRRSPTVNSLWLWGGGPAPAHVVAPYERVHATDPFARGLALLSGARIDAMPERLSEVDAPAGRACVILDAPANPLRLGDEGAWMEAAREVDEQWFSTLGEALGRFGEVRLVLTSASRTLVATLTSMSRFHWLATRRPLSVYA